MMAKWLRKCLFSLIPVTILLTSAEFSARMFWDQDGEITGGYGLPAHPTRIWGLPPGGSMLVEGERIEINEKGLRAVPETGAPYRILTLGDSNIYGHLLKDADTLHYQLKSALARRGIEADVFCGGVPGYSSSQSLRLLNEVGWSLVPDLVIMANLLSDEIKENFTDEQLFEALDDPAVRAERGLLGESKAWKWVRGQVREERRLDRRIRWLMEPNLFRAQRVDVRLYRKNLSRMLHLSRRYGVGAAIFQLATREQLTVGILQPDYMLMQALESRLWDVPLVLGLPVLQTSGHAVDELFMDSVHVTVVGNRLYAEAIADELVKQGWPEQRLVPSRQPAQAAGDHKAEP